jgi:hypoxanthine-guanine phosphoribosyltransferase
MRMLFSAAEIADEVDASAVQIARRIPAEFVTVGLLNGAAVFAADLVRAWTGPAPAPGSSSCG